MESKRIHTVIDTLNLTSFKDCNADWLAISDTSKSFWKFDEKQCITITKREAELLADHLMNFANSA